MFAMYEVVFFVFSIILITAAVMVITLRNSVYAALFLVLLFFSSAVLWIMMQAEFLALVLIFIYVGAVTTLFLFIVMMLNVTFSKKQEKFVRFFPFALMTILLLVVTMITIINSRYSGTYSIVPFSRVPSNFSNVKIIGTLLYTNYLYPFEIAAIILLVATISAVALALHDREKCNTKVQRVSEQLQVTKLNRLRIIKMEAEKDR
ncbi:NADH-quinone oxidoreductase subunit J [Coxiella endosymbiont of Amblyomma americanum]|uniref:NADH-quinone oxidoreductase subunit J n=1 Tax=Coxiella endosymbiont of Amblyomma americanum TaxID=325775 RepID=UPI00058233BA|nr:NADH:ubiquinone oxidoreductase subunit J [Coxiella endosymbiont of Amblyomma americanum]AUJ58631.1 NADH:ubiquinone oxidoreductase subunit J [Coxiella-like endosymbiont of Amblyomma americanum]